MGILISLVNLRVRSLDIDFNEVSWELEDTSEDVLDYTFQVQRSESPSGPFDTISVPFQDQYVFFDKALHTGDRWRKYYYQILVLKVHSVLHHKRQTQILLHKSCDATCSCSSVSSQGVAAGYFP
jgi:hypothetical protein